MRGWRFKGLERVQLHNEDISLVIQLGRTSVFMPHCHYEVLREQFVNQQSDKNQSITLFLAGLVTDALIKAWVAMIWAVVDAAGRCWPQSNPRCRPWHLSLLASRKVRNWRGWSAWQEITGWSSPEWPAWEPLEVTAAELLTAKLSLNSKPSILQLTVS